MNVIILFIKYILKALKLICDKYHNKLISTSHNAFDFFGIHILSLPNLNRESQDLFLKAFMKILAGC